MGDEMTEPSETEQELREKIAKIIEDYHWAHGRAAEESADQILILAKEAGYKSPEEIVQLLDELHPYKQSVFPKTREDIVKLLRGKGLDDAELTSTYGVLARIGYEVAIYHIQKHAGGKSGRG